MNKFCLANQIDFAESVLFMTVRGGGEEMNRYIRLIDSGKGRVR